MNYIDDVSPNLSVVSNATLQAAIGQTFSNATSITISPTTNTDISQLGLTPDLTDPQTTISFTTPNNNTVDTMVAQFAIYKNTLPASTHNILPPGIWEMNIYSKANASNDVDNIGLRFYLLGGTSGGTWSNLITGGSDIQYLLDHVNSQNTALSLYIGNPIDITGYDRFLVVLTSRNRNANSHQAQVYFQSS